MVKEGMTATEQFNMDVFGDSESIFSFRITRVSTEAVIWDTSIGEDILLLLAEKCLQLFTLKKLLGGLMFADQFIQIATLLPTDKMYGFGENIHQTLKVKFCLNFYFIVEAENSIVLA